MAVEAATDGRIFFKVEEGCVIAEYRWVFAGEPQQDLHVNEAIHGYHIQQFEIYF
jgi:hypothetical protein